MGEAGEHDLGSVAAAEFVEEAIVNRLNSAVRVPLVHQDGDLNLTGGDHVDVDSSGGQSLEHLAGHAGVVGHAGAHDRDLCNLLVELHGLEADGLLEMCIRDRCMDG